MKSLYRSLLALFTSFALTAGAFAQEQGTRDEAKAMTEAAIAHLKKVGHDKAFEDFNKDKANWIKKDLYIILMDTDGAVKAHGANEKLVGKNLLNLKDQNGKEFVKEFMVVASKGGGWVDYEWAHPISKKVEGKTTFVKGVAGTNLTVAVGVYR